MSDEEQQDAQTRQEDSGSERGVTQERAKEEETSKASTTETLEGDKNRKEEEPEEKRKEEEEAEDPEAKKKEEQRKKEEEEKKKKEEQKKKDDQKKKEEQQRKKKEEQKRKEEEKKEAERKAEEEAKKAEDERAETSDGRRQQREFFKEELKRLQGSLKRESSKIVPPSRRRHTPFVFNTLEPYYNTYTTRYMVDMPDEGPEKLFTFSSRSTAQGLTDPWIDLRMDQEILPQISARPVTRSDSKLQRRKKTPKKAEGDVNRKEGSTRLPKFPVVNLETKELATKQLYYSDVPMLRKELKTKYSSQARGKVDADYKRTQADFYRMDLDRLDQVAPNSRKHLTSTYMAYLQNTPGSRRAVSDCVRTLEGKAN